MKRLALTVTTLVAATTAFASAANADTNTIGLVNCTDGQTIEVSSADDVQLRAGWVAKNSGLVEAFLRASTTTLTIDGTVIPDAASYYEPTIRYSFGSMSLYSYDLGSVTAPTDVVYTVTLAHPLPDLISFNEDGTPYIYDGTILSASCTLVPTDA